MRESKARRRWRKTALSFIVALAFVAACFGLFLSFGARAETIKDDRDGFTDINLANGVSSCHTMSGIFVCRIWGTFDSATATVERVVLGRCPNPDKVESVSVNPLVNVSVETNDVRMEAGTSQYRLSVVGGLGAEQINWQCNRVRAE